MEKHFIPPVYNSNSRILILGSFPSVKSRETCFFYAHPQNRFWRVLSELLNRPSPETVPDKKSLLLSRGIALWDVIAECEIVGSSDTSVKNVVANNLDEIFDKCNIRAVFLNGKCAERYYNKFFGKKNSAKVYTLPSTSPANAAVSYQKLIEAWSVICEYLDD